MSLEKPPAILQPLISAEDLALRVSELGKEISEYYQDKDLILMGVLKGSFIFMADLSRSIRVNHACEFIRVSSYHKKQSSGTVTLDFEMTQSIEGKHVLLVEDIVDTGQTLLFLKKHLMGKNPASLRICTLLYKQEMNPHIQRELHWVGFEIPKLFVVGYGMDYEGLYRHLPFIGTL